MPVYLLGESIGFPPPTEANPDGIVAIGGDLSPERLLNAYACGIFPWYSEDEPILWFSPSPRLILFPEDLHISRSMKRVFNNPPFQITLDENFENVIENCSAPRIKQNATWITPEMKDAYIELHKLGFAHSVEVWEKDTLVGGLYGISLGKCFFGESMFALKSNASKFGFISFVKLLEEMEFQMVDCQVPTTHLKSLGAKEVSREKFLKLLDESLDHDTLRGKWTLT